MADVQIDNGEFTRIANSLLEQTSRLHLNGTQYSIVLTVWRFTYGFQRSEHKLSITFISKATGISARAVKKELKILIDRNIIIVLKESTNADSRVLKFNKDYESWEQGNKTSPGEQSIPSQGNNQSPQQGNKKTPKKKIKENSKENIPYLEIIEYLNVKAKTSFRPSSKKTRELIHARWVDKFSLDDFKMVIDKKVASWMKTNMEKYLRPETLFGTKFEGYLNEKNPTQRDKPKEDEIPKLW